MSRDHEQWQARRRGDSIVAVAAGIGFPILWLLFRTEWFGIAPDTMTFWFARFVALVLIVCAIGCVYHARRRKSTIPPINAAAPAATPPETE